MATTQNTYTGDGSTTNYSFTFEYLKQADVKVTLDTVATTAFTFANATTLSFTTAPASGVAIRIYRDTDIDTLQATFFAGSAIKAEDLNNNFTQSNFAVQESDFNVDTANTTAASAVTTANSAVTTANSAVTTANSAVTTANAATTTANGAVTTANSAVTSANAAVSTANTASTNATNAVNTANTASANINAAVTTANSAATDAATAITTANGAVTTANTAASDATTAVTTANNAVNTANSAVTTANGAVTTANTASTNASAAVTTANTASTNASNAVTTANTAAAAVSAAAFYSPIAALANLPGSPSNEDRVEVVNSTGVESNSSVSGVPAGFVGSTDLTVRLQYNSSTSKWAWQQYFAADPENRYLTESLPVVKGDSTNGAGQLTLNCENNSHGVKIKGPPHSAAATYTLTLPNNTGTSGQALKTDGNGTLSFADVSSSFITQTDFAYKPSSNTATLAGPGIASSSNTDPSGLNAFRGLNAYPNSSSAVIRFEKSTNTTFYNLVNQLSSNDAVTVVYDDGTNNQTISTTFHSLTDNTINNVVYGELRVNSSLGTFGTGSFFIESSQIVNGVDPIYDNEVLRYSTATNKWTVHDPQDRIITLNDFSLKPSSNQLTLSGPNVTNLSAANVTDQHYKLSKVGQELYINWRATNTTANACFDQMVTGNAITVGYYHYTNNTPTYTEITGAFEQFQDNTGSNPLEKWLRVVFTNNTFASPMTGSYPVVIKSSFLINGFDAIADNQVLRYKTATQKWTVDDAATISICDGGNFDNGSSLVTTTTTFDGGSFN